MTLEEFHTNRRMFVIIEGNIILAPEKLNMSHHEWLYKTLFGAEADRIIQNHTRGYILNNKIVAYIGSDFSDEIPEKDMKPLQELVLLIESGRAGSIPCDTYKHQILMVGLGAVKSDFNPWHCKRDIDVLSFIM